MPKQTALDTINRLIAEENSSGATRQRTGDAVRTIDQLIAEEEENDRRREEERQRQQRNAASATEAMDLVRTYGDYGLERRAAEQPQPVKEERRVGNALTPEMEARYQQANGVNRAPTAYQTYMMQVANAQPVQEETRSTDELRRDMNRQNRIVRGTERMAADMGNQLTQDQSLIYNPTYTSNLRTMGQTMEAQQAKADRATELYQTLSVQRREQEEREKYAALMSNPDFVAKSQGDPTIGNKTSSTSLAPAERLYQKIFHRNDTKDANGNIRDAAGSDAARFVNDEEAAIFYYLWNTQGAKAAQSYYYGYVENRAGERRAQLAQQQAQAYGEYDPVGASIARVGYNAMSGIGLVDMALQNLTRALGITDRNKPLNYNSDAQLPGQVADALQSGASNFVEQFAADEIKRINPNVKHPENYAKVASFLYQTGMSMADSSVAIALNLMGIPEPLTLANMGAAAGTRAIREARERGATDGQALAFGFSSAIMEALFEKISLDRILEPSYAQTTKEHLLNALKQSFTEGSEEVMTTLANTAADMLIMGDKAELYAIQRQLMEQGVSEKEALSAAFKQWGTGIVGDLLGGMISGFGMGGAKEVGTGLGVFAQGVRQDMQTARALTDYQNAQQAAPQITPQQTPAAPVQQRQMTAREQNPLQFALNKAQNGETVTGNDAKAILNDPQAVQTLRDAGVLAENIRPGADGRTQIQQAVQALAEQNRAETPETQQATERTSQLPVQNQQETAQERTTSPLPRQMAQEQQERVTTPPVPQNTQEAAQEPTLRLLAQEEQAPQQQETLRIRDNEVTEPTRQAPLTIRGANATVEENRQEESYGQGQQTETAAAAGEGDFRSRAETAAEGARRSYLDRIERSSGLGRVLQDLRNYRVVRGAESRASEVSRIRNQAEAGNQRDVSAQDYGIANGSAEQSAKELDNATASRVLGRNWDRAVAELARQGVTLKAMTGQLKKEDGTQVRAFFSGDGKTIVVQVDHPKLSWNQLLDHEDLHRRIKADKNYRKAVDDALLADKNLRAYLPEIIDRYSRAYAKFAPDLTSDDVIEELLADYRAGFDMLDPLGMNSITARAAKRAAKDIKGVERKGVAQAENGGENQQKGRASNEIEAPYNRTALLTEDTVDRWLKDYASASSPKYAQAYIARMSPEQFLKLTTSRTGRLVVSSQTGPMDAEQLIKSTQAQPLQLIIRDGEVVGHEGRHRVTALDRANVRSIPVLVFDSSNKNSKTDVPEMVLQGQDFGSSRSYDRVTLENMIPLSYENRDRIVQEYGKQDAFERSTEKLGYRQTMKFSLNMPVEETADLIAVHNLTERNLIDMGKLGGAPAPSIAIVNAENGHSKYGPISLVYGKDTIDPRKSSKNKVYGSDAWTPTAPRVDYELDYDGVLRLEDQIETLSQSVADGIFRDSSILRQQGIDDSTSMTVDELADKLASKDAIKAAYLADKGGKLEAVKKAKEWGKYDNETLQKLIDQIGPQRLAQINADLAEGKRLGAAEETIRQIIRDYYAKRDEAILQKRAQRNGWTAEETDARREKHVDNMMENNVSYYTLEKFAQDAWAMYEDGGATKGENDYYSTQDALRNAVDDKTAKEWIKPQLEALYGQPWLYNGKDPYMANGNRRSFRQTHDAYTLENIVKAMSSQQSQRGQGLWGATATGLQATATPSYGSIAEIKADSGRLGAVSGEDYEAQVSAVDDELTDVINEITGPGAHFSDREIAGSLLVDAAQGSKTVAAIRNLFAKESDLRVSEATAKKIQQLYQHAAALPMEYFEAKPMRAVGFDEIVAAIVPDTISDNARKVLTDNGVNTLEYRSGDDNDRLEKLNSLEGAKFSREIDADYLSAVNSGDMETAQRMVDEAAKAAGYSRRMWHGAKKGKNFTVFKGWSYFTENQKYAERYTGQNPENLYGVYAKIEHPFDTRTDRQARRDFKSAREEYGMGQLGDRGLPDWTDGYDIVDYIEENGKDYDAVILDEGGDLVNGEPVYRGESYVIRNSAQVKSADPVTYNDDGNVIPLSERFNQENQDIRYSIEIDPEVAAQFSPEAIARRQSNRTKGVKGERKVSRVRSNTYEYSGLFNEVEAQMDEADEENYTYDPVSEKKSMNEALGRLKADFDGEVSRLSEADRQWGGSDLDTAMGILHRYRTEGRATGDYGDFWRWSKVIQEKGTKGGQFIQAFAKYTRTGTGAAMKGAKDIHDRFKLNPAQQKQVDAAKKKLMDGIDGDMNGAAQDAMKQAKGQKEPGKKQDGKVDKKKLDAEVQRRKDAERLVREISKLFEKQQNHGEPVENWLKLTGEELARKIAGRFSEPKQRTKTTMQTILSDLVGFAEEHALPERKKAEGEKRTAIDIITDYLNNRDAYGTAWAAAQSYLRAAYTDDQEKLDALNSFLGATIAYNAEGTDRTMLDAILQSADVLGISEKRILELTSAGANNSTIDRIGDELVSQVKERMGADYDESFTQQLKDAVRRHITGIALQESAEEQRLRLGGMTTDAARQLDMNLQKLLTQSRGDKNKAAQSVADYLIRELGIPSSDAAIAAERITGAFMDELASRADRKLQQMFAAKAPKTQEQRDRLLDLIRLGGLTNSNAEDAVVDALGIGGMSRERQRELVGAMAQFGETLDAMEADDLDGLKDLIRAQAAVRNTPLSRQAEKTLAGETDAEYLREFALAQLDAIAGDFAEMSPGAKISTFQTISHLLNMRTALRNLTSNQVFDLVDSAANNLATIPDMVIGAFTGKRTVGVNKSWLSEMKRAGARQGAARNALEVRLDVSPDDRQKSKYGTAGRRTNSMAASNAFGRILSHLEEVMGYELNTTDEFHKGSVRGETLESLARFVERGDITQEQANAWAEEEALYRSFQDDTLVGNIMGELKTLLNVIGFGDSGKTNSRGRTIHDFGLGDLVVKYTQVPGALIHRGIEYSPLGYAKMLYDLAIAKDSLVRTQRRGEDVTNAQRKLALDIGRATTGSGLITLFAVLAKAGLLRRDDDDKDKNAKAMHAAQGLSGTQLNLTALKRWIEGGDLSLTDGDVLADIGFLEPLDSLMTIATLMANDDDLKLTDIGVKSLDGVWKAISNTSAMQTISNIISTVQYHDEENDLPLYFQIPIEIASDSISGFVPSPVRQLAQATDTTYRDQYRSKNLNDQIQARVMNSIPGLRQTLAPKITPLGEDRKYQKPLLNYLNATLNPGNINVYQGSGVVDELNRVYGETDDEKIWPERNAPYSFKLGDEKITLTPDERTQYQRTRGQTTANAMESVMSTDWYKSMGATDQAEVLNWIGNFSNFVAKKEMLAARGQEYGSTTYNKYFEAWQSGTPIEDVVADKYGKLIKVAEETAAANSIIAEVKIPETSKAEAETMSDEAKRYYAGFLKGGVSDATARKLATELEGSSASGHEQWRKVYDSAGSEGEKAVTSVMTDDMKRNWDLAKNAGVSMDDYIKVRENYIDLDGRDNSVQAEWNATLDSFTFSTNAAKDKSIKGTLWQILTGSGSTKNNPYDKEAGQKVIDAKSGGGSGSGSYAPARIPTLRIPEVPKATKPSSGLRLPATNAAPRQSSGLRLK